MAQFHKTPHITRPISALIAEIKESNIHDDSKKELISLTQHLHHEYPLNVVKILRDNYIPISNLTTEAYQQGYRLKMGQLDMNFPKRLFTEFEPSVVLSYALPEAVMCISLLENHILGLTQGPVHHALYYFWGHSITESQIAQLKDVLKHKTYEWRKRMLDRTHYHFIHAHALEIPVFDGAHIDFAKLYTITGINEHGDRDILTLTVSFEDEYTVWTRLFNELKNRGMNPPLMISADLSPVLMKLSAEHFPTIKYQICSKSMRNALNEAFERVLNTDECSAPPKDVAKSARQLVTALFEPNTEYQVNVQLKAQLEDLTEKYPSFQEGINLLNQYFDNCFTYLTIPVAPNYNYTMTSNSAERINKEAKKLSECPYVYASTESAELAMACFMQHLEFHNFFKRIKLKNRERF
ncbi:transposase [Staphylococcus simulans]